MPLNPSNSMPTPLLGASGAVRELRELIAAFGPTPLPVLVTGESGTGKSAVALALHRASDRAGPFVDGSVTELVTDLAIEQLKGHARGAYTGADRDAPGLFEQAHRGTLFLDEIGDAPPPVQRILLTLLDGRPIQRLGEQRARCVDVRVISATNRDIEARITEGHFRADLCNRLRVFEVRVPPLRERRDDLHVLIPRVLARIAARVSRPVPEVPAKVMDRLLEDPYPGNFRDLESALAHLVVCGRLPAQISRGAGAWREQLEWVLLETNGNISEAARRLGKHRRTLHRELQRRAPRSGTAPGTEGIATAM